MQMEQFHDNQYFCGKFKQKFGGGRRINLDRDENNVCKNRI